jgi:hypothetical protein
LVAAVAKPNTVPHRRTLGALLAELAVQMAESLDRSPVVPIEEISIARRYGYLDAAERRRAAWQQRLLRQEEAREP